MHCYYKIEVKNLRINKKKFNDFLVFRIIWAQERMTKEGYFANNLVV